MGFRLGRTKTDNRNKDTKIQYKVHIFGHLNLNQHNILFLIGISLVSVYRFDWDRSHLGFMCDC